MAGLRIGYAIGADAALPAALRQTQVPFAVSTIAQEAALASLEPEAAGQLAARLADVIAERARVFSALRELGYPVPQTQANFVWLPLGAAAAQWAAGCEERGVIVRAFAGSGARVTIGDEAENDRFLGAAAALAPPPSYGAGP